MYILVEDEINKNLVIYTDELKIELDKRINNYNNGMSFPVTAIESKKRIQNILKTVVR